MKIILSIAVILVFGLACLAGYRLGKSDGNVGWSGSETTVPSTTSNSTAGFKRDWLATRSQDGGAGPTEPAKEEAAGRIGGGAQSQHLASQKRQGSSRSASPDVTASIGLADEGHRGGESSVMSVVGSPPSAYKVQLRPPVRTAAQRAVDGSLAAGRVPLPAALSGGASENGGVRTPDSTSLPPEAQAAVRQTAEEFAAAVGGTSQSPNDPAYLAKWIRESERSDMLLKQRLGVTAWQRLKAEIAQKAYNDAHPELSQLEATRAEATQAEVSQPETPAIESPSEPVPQP